MKSLFTAEFFTSNRQNLRDVLDQDIPLVVAANGLLQRNSDSTFPFRQDSNFWYLTGIDEPDVLLVLEPNTEYLIVPTRETSRVAFDGDYNKDTLAKRSGVTQVFGEKEGWERLAKPVRKAEQLATVAKPPAFVKQHGFYTNPARARLTRRLKTINDSLDITDVRNELAILRSIKQASELKAIQKAIGITGDTLEQIYKNLSTYKYEYEIEADITANFLRAQCWHAYQPIVAGGKHACTLHYINNNAKLNKDELLLVDAGAEVENYAADITRTWAIDGKSTKRQELVISTVIEIQKYAFTLLKQDVTIKENEAKIEQFMGEKLKELGLIKEITHENVRKFYPHATSHFLGLDVHDVGQYDQPLKPGMVLTVEPGIYIPKEGIGVRIEDDVLITKNGIEVLSKKIPAIL